MNKVKDILLTVASQLESGVLDHGQVLPAEAIYLTNVEKSNCIDTAEEDFYMRTGRKFSDATLLYLYMFIEGEI